MNLSDGCRSHGAQAKSIIGPFASGVSKYFLAPNAEVSRATNIKKDMEVFTTPGVVR